LTVQIYFLHLWEMESRDSSVGISLGYGLGDRGSRFRFPAGAGNFSLHHRVQNGSGAHPSSCPVGNRGYFPGDKAAGHEADYSPPSSAEVKECVELYLHSQYTFMAWCSVKKKSTGTTLPSPLWETKANLYNSGTWVRWTIRNARGSETPHAILNSRYVHVSHALVTSCTAAFPDKSSSTWFSREWE
jgi:hypothetical protein